MLGQDVPVAIAELFEGTVEPSMSVKTNVTVPLGRPSMPCIVDLSTFQPWPAFGEMLRAGTDAEIVERDDGFIQGRC